MSSGLKVQCPNCKRQYFEVTDRYDPDKTPNGGMVRCLLPYAIDWLCSSSTLTAEMTCPECLAQLAPKGMLHVLYPARDCGQFFKESDEFTVPVIQEANIIDKRSVFESVIKEDDAAGKSAFVCDVCGKSCKTALALAGHKRSHK